MRRLRIAFLFGLALLLGGLVFVAWPEGPDFDPAPLRVRAERYDVRILRDRFGVPHVYGATDADVAFGLAYAHAEDDARTIQQVTLAVRGRLATVEGRDAAPLDYVVALLGFWEDVEAGYMTRLSPAVRALAEGYADGFNLYAALHPEEILPGVVPMRGQDVVAGFVFKTPLFYGFDRELAGLLAGDGEAEGSQAPVSLRLSPGGEAFRLARASLPPLGSNAVAVAPGRSTDGATRLLVNSHQPYEGPVAWYEVRLKSGEGWDMAGGVFPGSPLVLHGHNRDLGWASTVNRPDLFDAYRLVSDETKRLRYRLGDEWLDLESHRVTLWVRLLGRLRIPVRREVLRSRHGPAIETPSGIHAFRYGGMGEVRQIEQYYRMNRARSFDEWWRAMQMQAIPSINFVYADRTGTIAYLYNAALPERAPGVDWSGVLPGDRPELIPSRILPLEATPHVIDPPSGFVVSCNHTPFRATAAGQGPRAGDFPERMGIERRMTNRGLRSLELYGGDAAIDREAFRAHKYDKRYSPQSDISRFIDGLIALDLDDEPALAEAQALLREWERDTEIDNRGTALAVLAALPAIEARRAGQDPPAPREALRSARDALLAHHGRLDPAWGEVNRFRRGVLDLPMGGGPDVLRAAEASSGLEADGTFTVDSGDTLVLFVEWDARGELRSDTIHQYGSATLDPDSTHYADQVPLFLAEDTKRVPLAEAALRAQLEREYRPGEERLP